MKIIIIIVIIVTIGGVWFFYKSNTQNLQDILQKSTDADIPVQTQDEPFEVKEFVLTSSAFGFRIELLRFFTEEDLASKENIIVEKTWSISDEQNRTVWYLKTDEREKEIDSFVWDKGMEF